MWRSGHWAPVLIVTTRSDCNDPGASGGNPSDNPEKFGPILKTQDSRLKTQDSRLKTQDSRRMFPEPPFVIKGDIRSVIRYMLKDLGESAGVMGVASTLIECPLKSAPV